MSRFDYDIVNARDGGYIASMMDKSSWEPGDELAMPEELLFIPNSKRLRICKIEAVSERQGEETRLYITPTKKEYIPAGRVVFRNSKKFEGIDWSGSDGWLKLDSK